MTDDGAEQDAGSRADGDGPNGDGPNSDGPNSDGPNSDGPNSDGPNSDVRDRALLAAHLAGDPHAFGTLVGHHRDRLWAVALRTVGDREEAADALQDALLSAYRSAAGFRGEARVTTWLHRVVVNACLDRLRRRRARPTVPLPEGGAEPASPRDALAERETALDVESALAALPDDQRAALVLVDLQGLPVEQAARALGVPAGTVKSRCSRGRARLAVSLGHLRNRESLRPVPPSSGTDPVPDPSGGAP